MTSERCVIVRGSSASRCSPSTLQPRRRAWGSPSEVEPGTGVERQVMLIKQLVAGGISAPEFAREWLAARRRVLDEGERVRERFERILTDIFYLLDDYVIDPMLRGPEDMSDEALISRVEEAHRALIELNTK